MADEPITRNGVRLWQTVSAAAIVAVVGAIGWNYSQLNSIEVILGEMRAGGVKESSVAELRSRDAAMQAEIAGLLAQVAKIDALQQLNMERIGRLERRDY